MDVAFEDLLDSAVKHNFYSVCVSPYIAEPIVRALQPYPQIKVGTVVAFPHGNIPLALKLQQVEYFINAGVDEIDWVLHYGEVFNEKWHHVATEMGLIAARCREAGIVGKCIVETGALINDRLIAKVFEIGQQTNLQFIKTSTGFGGEGAKVEHIKLWHEMRAGANYPKIKASGGIKTAEKALALISAGADRLGLSSSVEVMEQYNALQPTFTEGEKKTG